MGILSNSYMVRHCQENILIMAFMNVSIFWRERKGIIPSFIIEHFERTGEKKLPLPRVKSTKQIGNMVHHELVYEDDESLSYWVPLENYTDLGDTVSLSCRTEKDRDKRYYFKAFLWYLCWLVAMWSSNLFWWIMGQRGQSSSIRNHHRMDEQPFSVSSWKFGHLYVWWHVSSFQIC